MWGSNGPDATRLRLTAKGSGSLPGLERAHFPAFVPLAGFALHPGLRRAADITCQEIAAGLAVLGIGRGDRRDSAARAGVGIFPRRTGVFATAAKHVGGGRPRVDKIAVGRPPPTCLAAVAKTPVRLGKIPTPARAALSRRSPRPIPRTARPAAISWQVMSAARR